MATSGTNAFNLDVDEVIQEAFERCGLHARSGYDLKSARRSLNLLLAEWANRGINLWTVELRTQTLTASTTSYTLDSDLIDILEAVVYKASDTRSTWKLIESAVLIFKHFKKINRGCSNAVLFIAWPVHPNIISLPNARCR